MIKTEQTYKNAAFGLDREVLGDIHLPFKNIAIYKRNIAPLKTMLAAFAEKTIAFQASGTVEKNGEKRLLLRIDTDAAQNLWS